MTDDKTKQEIEVYRTRANEITVRTPEESQAAEALLGELRTRKKAWLAAVQDTVKSAHTAWKAAVAHRDSIAKPIAEAEKVIKATIAAYAFECKRKAAEERKRLQAEADARAEAERRRAIKAAEKLKTAELKEIRLEEAEAIVAPVVRAEPKPPETKLSMVVTYGFEITDPAKVPTEYMIPDEKKIGAVIRASKGSVQIPGVRVVKRETVR